MWVKQLLLQGVLRWVVEATGKWTLVKRKKNWEEHQVTARSFWLYCLSVLHGVQISRIPGKWKWSVGTRDARGATLHNLNVSSIRSCLATQQYIHRNLQRAQEAVTDSHMLPRFASFLCLNGCLWFVQGGHTLGWQEGKAFGHDVWEGRAQDWWSEV